MTPRRSQLKKLNVQYVQYSGMSISWNDNQQETFLNELLGGRRGQNVKMSQKMTEAEPRDQTRVASTRDAETVAIDSERLLTRNN